MILRDKVNNKNLLKEKYFKVFFTLFVLFYIVYFKCTKMYQGAARGLGRDAY